MTSGADRHTQDPSIPAQVGGDRGDETVGALLREHHLVCHREHRDRVGIPVCENPDRVARHRRNGRGLLTLALDVSDCQTPAPRAVVHVVEVAAHVQAFGRSDVRGRYFHVRDVRHLLREQARLEGLDDFGPAHEHPVNLDRERDLLAELLHQAEIGDLQRPFVGAADQGQGAIAAFTVRQRDAKQRRRAEQREHWRAGFGNAEDGDILRVRKQP